MKNDLQKRSSFYRENFEIVPSFKAGLHFGNVTTGEIGALKKEIFFTGDVLNTISRIQGLCKSYQKELLVSGDLIKLLPPGGNLKSIFLDKTKLKGRKEPVEIYPIEEAGES